MNNPSAIFKVEGVYKVDMIWVSLIKIPLIISDIVIALLITYYFKKYRGYVLGLIWYLSPAVIYVSSIFGMFDQLVALFIFLSIVFYEKKGELLAGLSSAIAFLLKQYALIPISLLILHSIIYRGKKHFLRLTLTMIITILTLLAPFIIFCEKPFESMWKIVSLILLARSAPYYPKPYCYNFNGITSLLTWIHDICRVETIGYFKFWTLILTLLLLPIILLVIKKRIENTWTIMFLGYSCFIISLWRINYQYLIPFIMLAISTYITEKDKWIKKLTLTLTLYPSIWFFIFPCSFWFYYHIPKPNTQLINILNIFSLRVVVDYIYIIYSVVFTLLVILTYYIITMCYSKEEE